MIDPDNNNDDYEVGFGRPPKAHQQQPGQPSRNPYGRKGKPENRPAIAARHARKSLRSVILEVSRKLHTVNMGDGRTAKMEARAMLLQKAVSEAMAGNMNAAFKLLNLFDRQEREPPRSDEVERMTGVMVLSQTANTMDETLEQLELEDRTRRLRLELAALQGVVDAARVVRTGGPLPQAPPDPRETRAYGEGSATGAGRMASPSPPTPGRSLKADGRYR